MYMGIYEILYNKTYRFPISIELSIASNFSIKFRVLIKISPTIMIIILRNFI